MIRMTQNPALTPTRKNRKYLDWFCTIQFAPYRPSHCPDKFWTLIESCWAQDPLQRPSFSSIESQLQVLLKLQSSFRRQSQIKSRQEAFLVEVPLDDLLSSVLAVGGSTTPRSVTSPVEPSPLRRSSSIEQSNSSVLDSRRSSEEQKISVNLSFNLDSNIYLTTIPTLPLGIDLPVKTVNVDRDGSDTDSDGENEDGLPIHSIEEWSSEYDESIFAFWDVLINADVADPMQPVPWSIFTAALQNQYPTIITSLPSLKSAFQDPHIKHHASFTTFRKYITTQIPESAMSISDSFAPLESIFGQFCIAQDASRNPQSTGPVSPTRIQEAITNVTSNSIAINTQQHYIHSLVTLPNSLGLDILTTLTNPRIFLEATTTDTDDRATATVCSFSDIINCIYDSKGYLPLHSASKLSSDNSRVIQVLLKHGADPLLTCKKGGWTALHIASWSGATLTVSTLLNHFSSGHGSSKERHGLISVKDDEGWTCLMHAARYGHLETVKVIVESSRQNKDAVVNDNGDDDDGGGDRETLAAAIELSEQYGWRDVTEYLKSV
ncbi:hypothetical protein BDR26DRAFT_501765 [Obelidium mucronatum]|nr:hypothetical protein BDR26DRAFT_501765 [Obelidium mucronatum]